MPFGMANEECMTTRSNTAHISVKIYTTAVSSSSKMENRWKNNQDNSDDGSNSSSNMQIYFKVL
jgi:hypothetical protein